LARRIRSVILLGTGSKGAAMSATVEETAAGAKGHGELQVRFQDVAKENPIDHTLIARVLLGDPDSPSASNVFWIRFTPGHHTEPHSHASDYCEVILEGSLRVGKKWLGPGDVRIVKAGTGYGPLEAGPEGVTALVIFESDFKTIPKGSTPPDYAAKRGYSPEAMKELLRPINV
jgi:hypothetical protein